ncbi:hypothetical protein CBL_02947 [Carabus blaptoides fortunei]
MKPTFADRLPPGSEVRMTTNGSMTTEVFVKWLEHFSKFMSAPPVILIFDGDSSHLDISIVDKAEELGIHLLCLPSNTTHELQPMDKAVFKAFENYWDQELLQATGIFPFNKNMIPDYAYAPSLPTNRVIPEVNRESPEVDKEISEDEEWDSEDEQPLSLLVNKSQEQKTAASNSFSEVLVTPNIEKSKTVRKKAINYKAQERFNYWKNATRSKYRRIQEHRYKTGGGPETVITLTPVEERGINVWRKVTVAGSCKVLATGGLASPSIIDMNTSVDCDVNFSEVQMASASSPCTSVEILSSSDVLLEHIHLPESPSEHQQSPVSQRTFKKKTPLKPNARSLRQNRPLNEVAVSLMNIYTENMNASKDLNNSLKRLGDLYQECVEKKLKLKRRRLELNIAKYKFENKGFEFN